jgi:cysteine desulfurase family protein (TIGR01976 family)
MALNIQKIRAKFPSLARPAIFLDAPGGTQICQQSLERIENYLLKNNANCGGAFATSRASDETLAKARQAMADFYNAAAVEEIIFGNNMTTLTFHLSRSIARNWKAGDEIVVTRLDHDANVTPWLLAAKERGVGVNRIGFDLQNGTLNLDELAQALERKPKLLAVGYASNALGTINPIRKIIRMAHAAGTLVYVDAVQFAPHGAIDVQRIDADFLVSSAYKFFGTHAGILYGKKSLLEELFAYKVRPASNELPDKFETGTQNHEGIAGILGAIEYFEWLGEEFGGEYGDLFIEDGYSGRRLTLKKALTAIHAYEMELSQALLSALNFVPNLKLYGLNDFRQADRRVPTFAFRIEGVHPHQVAETLGSRGIYVWDGNYYAINVTEQLGVEESGGMVRVGAAHYNTLEEIREFGEALLEIAP